MPNWCNNVLFLSHDDAAMMKRFAWALKEYCVCEEFIPVPDGVTDWVSFCTENWGTKWDFGDLDYWVTVEEGITANFDTAWTPPVPLYKKLESLGYKVTGYYFEVGQNFAGKYTDGVDMFYQLPTDDLPEDLDRIMDITGFLTRYSEMVSNREYNHSVRD